MSWEWVAGHVKDISQDELIDLVRHTMPSLSNQNIIETERGSGNDGPYLKAQEALMISVSPPVNGWVTYWGYNHRFCSWVIRHNQLDGFLFHGAAHRDPFLYDNPTPNYWNYMYWEKGNIVDWFASDTYNHFSDWISEVHQDIVLPYLLFHELDKSVPYLAEIADRGQFMNLISENPALFSGNIEVFKEVLKSDISNQEFSDWLSFELVDGLKTIPRITTLPFSGLEYSIEMIGVYEDLRHNRENPINGSSYWAKEIEKQSAEWKKALPTFKHIYFEHAPGVDRDQIYWENFDLFLYT